MPSTARLAVPRSPDIELPLVAPSRLRGIKRVVVLRWLLRFVLAGAACFIAGRLVESGPQLAGQPLVWAPAGIALATLLRWGPGFWPALWVSRRPQPPRSRWSVVTPVVAPLVVVTGV